MPEKKDQPVTDENAKLEKVYNTVMNWLNTEMGNRITQNNSFSLMHQVSQATGLPAPRFLSNKEEG